VALDPLDPQRHWALGRAFLLVGEIEPAVEELEAAVDLNPNFALGQYSLAFGLGFGNDDPMTYAFFVMRAALHRSSACLRRSSALSRWRVHRIKLAVERSCFRQ
jgi:hypothetical protein